MLAIILRAITFWKIDPERWKETLSLNSDASYNTARSFLEHAVSNQSGSLVFIGSTGRIYGEAGHSDYAAAKGAITSVFLCL